MTHSEAEDDEARREIAALIAGEDEAWNKGDAAAFAARVLPDIIFTNVVGMFSIGKAPFVAQHERIFATIYQGSTNHQQIVHIKLLRPGIAIVDTLATVTGFQHARRHPRAIGAGHGARAGWLVGRRVP